MNQPEVRGRDSLGRWTETAMLLTLMWYAFVKKQEQLIITILKS